MKRLLCAHDSQACSLITLIVINNGHDYSTVTNALFEIQHHMQELQSYKKKAIGSLVQLCCACQT